VLNLKPVDEALRLTLRSPKRKSSTASKASEGFPYYAGYSEAFAEDALRLFAPPNAIVLDPWNGAGTTSAMAAASGFSSVSFDLNPVMVVVAKARLGNRDDMIAAGKKLRRYFKDFGLTKIQPIDDPLVSWIGPNAAPLIRYIINRCLHTRAAIGKPTLKAISEKISAAEIWQCIIILSIFRAVKRNCSAPVSSNPTWTKLPASGFDGFQSEIWVSLISVELEHLLKIACTNERKLHSEVATNIRCGSSECLDMPSESVDFVLTSPPYCTRIDYAVSTLCELAVLGLEKSTVDLQLRRELLGSTANKGGLPLNEGWGEICLSFLKNVEMHPSHGSRTYYYKNFAQYFNSLYNSIQELARVMKKGGTLCTVLQGSHYKEYPIDLPAIFGQMAIRNSLDLVDMHSFDASQFFVNINSSSLKYRGKKSMCEQVLVLRKRR
jgi:DNA modification methylase